ncbi:uncharacterized protein UMAG_00038 [Mycosarcoma maydis]|uniref:Transaldolase n=1 Tax=Mycosarcoma maydis TaxID=5270 RepID=A0A0D1EB81_MYCMD|nr:uncharacterized protein UMAG_00038 [Ustilago maydis 521]KIS71595.1 hypothetical protein UMAG_00038 [Ustilago maydis 521]|eukprot:XP_011386013.1 hypothetical protein UMAG_00038 [Ustilago maydis 521]
MTLELPTETTHLSDSLLAEFARHTTIDIDNNVASIAAQHNLAHRRLLELDETKHTNRAQIDQQVVNEFQSLFHDMTSNQIIVLSTYSELLTNDKNKAAKLVEMCVAAAKQIKGGMWNGKQLSSTVLERISVDGLTGAESDEEKHQQLASDILTVHFGLEMLPNLLASGNLHAQTATSQAYNASATVRHARRFVALYELISGDTVDSSRVCIKIPTTIAGLQAMRFLSSGGILDENNVGGPLLEGKIQVLATTVFAVEQGLAAAQAAGATYVAPYINALAAHFFDAENPSAEDKQKALDAGGRSISEIIYPLQRCLRRMRQQNNKIKTKVMAASFINAEEAIELCGLDHVTLGAGIVQALATTKLTDGIVETMHQASDKMRIAEEKELERYCATLAAIKDGEAQGCGGWLKQGHRSHARLEIVLTQDERCRYMLADALARFTSAEVKLRQLFVV